MQHEAPRLVGALGRLQHLLGMRAAPLVDSLEIVPRQQQATRPEQTRDDEVLEFARILHLVDIDVEEAPRPAARHRIVRQQQTRID